MKPERDPTTRALKIAVIVETIAVIVLTIALCLAIFVIAGLSIELAHFKAIHF